MSSLLKIVFLIFVFFCIKPAFANCEIGLSLLEGSNKNKEQSQELESEILEQLKGLPFSTFSLVKKESKKGDYNQVTEFDLVNCKGKNKVTITPLKAEGDKVQALIDWSLVSGENILSSKMWLSNGGNMVFGTDHDDTTCTVINVFLKCE